ncbi:hemerythrin domain-containing protein [Sphingobium mellinum]|uniref:hemerythrin domain-containing protein n=1 Tax=Sphingobium mellinum TaxID=1387166 RepID=UPI0030EEB0B2
MDVDELRRQHQQLSLLSRQLLQAVEDSQIQQSVGAIRWQLARQLMSHLALEDRIFYPAVQRSADEQARTMAQRLQSEMGMLAQNFSAYMQRWNDDQIARFWPDFCSETRDVLTMLKARMEQEERLLYPIAEAAHRQAMAMSKSA